MAWSNRNKRGRPRKPEPQDDPFDRIAVRRKLYAWLRPDERKKKKTERDGTIDQDVCDGIGQLCALGLLEAEGFHPIDLRDKGREWANHYISLLRKSGFKGSSYERMDKARHEVSYTARDARFDMLDNEVRSLERWALYSLLVDPIVGSYPDGRENAGWVEAFICQGLLEKGKFPPAWMQPVKFPDSYDRGLLEAAIRGLVILADGSQMRRAA